MTERIAGVLERASAGEDKWKLPKFDGDYMDVAVKSENLDAFKSILDRANVHYETMIEDLGIAIQENLKSVQPAYTSLEDYDYGKYGTFEDYQAWQRDFVEANSDMITLSSYGTSFEGRDLNVMKIGSGSKVGQNRGGRGRQRTIRVQEILILSLKRQLSFMLVLMLVNGFALQL